MNLSSTQIKDTYGNLVTIGTVAGTPTTGTLQNGAGSDLTSITLNGGAIFNEGGGDFDFRVEGDTDANLLFVDASTDRVGIGTNAPNGKLDVQGGTIEFDPGTGADSTRAFNFNIGGENYGKILVPSGSGGAMAFYTGGIGLVSERLRITSTGNVGIGTTSAGSKLAISDNGTGLVFINAASGEFNLGLLAGAASTDAYIYQRANAPMIFGTNNTERLRITSTGNVGIGCTPSYPLEVRTASAGRVRIGDGTNSIDFFPTTGQISTGTDVILKAFNATGSVAFHAGTGAPERMRVGSSETVVNDGQVDHDFRVESDTNSHALFVDAGNDRVGIGTGSPDNKMTLRDGSINIYSVQNSADDYRFIGTQFDAGNPNNSAQVRFVIDGADTKTRIAFATSNGVGSLSEKMRITSAGNVKIGGTANRATTEGSAQLVLFNGTAPVGTLANGVSFYSASGEANVMDAAGNATLLSPHDKETNEWIFRSKHTPTGKVLKIDVERMLRFINDHFGLDMIEEFTEA